MAKKSSTTIFAACAVLSVASNAHAAGAGPSTATSALLGSVPPTYYGGIASPPTIGAQVGDQYIVQGTGETWTETTSGWTDNDLTLKSGDGTHAYYVGSYPATANTDDVFVGSHGWVSIYTNGDWQRTTIFISPTTGFASTPSGSKDSVSIASAGSSYLSQGGSATQANEGANQTLLFIAQWDVNFSSSATSDGGIMGEWSSAGDEFLLFYDNTTKSLRLGQTLAGTSSATLEDFGALPTQGTTSFVALAWNTSGAAATFAGIGVSVPAGDAGLFQSSTGAAGSWTQVGSYVQTGQSGFNLSDDGSPFEIGDFDVTSSSAPITGTIYQAALGDYTMTYTPGSGFGGTILAEPPIPTAASYPATGPDGQTWTNTGMTVVP